MSGPSISEAPTHYYIYACAKTVILFFRPLTYLCSFSAIRICIIILFLYSIICFLL